MISVLCALLIFGYLAFAFYKREWAISLMPLFFPLFLIRFQILGIPFTLLEGLCYAIAIPVLVDLFQDMFSGKFKYNHFYFFADLLFLACIIGVIIVPKETLLVDLSVYRGRLIALGILKGFILAPMLYFASFIRTIKTDKFKDYALRAYLVSSVILAGWGIYQSLTGDFITPDFRASGPFESANYLAFYIGPACSVSFVYLWRAFVKEDEIKGTILSFLSFLILFIAILFTKSYGAFLALLFAIFVFAFFSVRRFWKGVVLSALAILLVIFVILNLGSDKMGKLFEFTERSSSAVRIEVWTVAASLIEENPVFGIGLGQFEPRYQLGASEILGHAPYEWVMLHPHNLYLAFWLNSGLFGLIAFFGFCVLGLRNFVLADERRRKYMVFGVLILVSILLHGLIDVPFWKNDLAMIFFLGMGFLV